MAAAKREERGQGRLRFSGHDCAVDYVFTGDPKRLNGKGVMNGDIEDMRAAFQAGRATLQFDDGGSAQLTVVAQSEGDPRAFFEVQTARPY